MEYFILSIISLGLTVLFFRLLGAWMFRITDVIKELKKIRKVLERDSKYSEEYLTKPNKDGITKDDYESYIAQFKKQ